MAKKTTTARASKPAATTRKPAAKKTAAKKATTKKTATKKATTKKAATKSPAAKPGAGATTPAQYLAALPDDRRRALQAVRKVINDNLPKGYREGMQYGMIGWSVPHSVYPAGYHCDPRQPVPFASVASQKNHMAVYLFCIYTDPTLQQRFTETWLKSGRKLDMGKGCVRFKKLDDVSLEAIAQAVKNSPVEKFLHVYEQNIPPSAKRRATNVEAKPAAKKANQKKAATKKPTRKAATK